MSEVPVSDPRPNIRLMIADDHQLVREGLTRLLGMEADIQVTSSVASGEELLEAVRNDLPDVVLVDVRMPGMGGIATVREISARWPQLGVVLLTMHDEDEYVFQGISAGARAYLVKDCSHAELLQALRLVARGGAYLPSTKLGKLMQQFRKDARAPASPPPAPPAPALGGRTDHPLSRREMDVLAHVVRGLSNKQIARELSIDETTVKTHLHRIFEKLRVSDRTQAAILALNSGWFPMAPR